MAVLALFVYLFLRSAWAADDSFIVWRTVENFLQGHGLRWNTAERVQTFTSPLWLMLVTPVAALSGEFYYTPMVISLALCIWVFVTLWRELPSPPIFVLIALILMASKAFVDFTGSGLEGPIVYFLLVMFYTRTLWRDHSGAPTRREIGIDTLLVALLYLARPDSVLLVAMPLAYIWLRGIRILKRTSIAPILAGLSPAILWTAFTLIYYGFPFPNSYYAKLDLGVPRGVLLDQGVYYLRDSFTVDYITLPAIIAGIVLTLTSRSIFFRAVGLSISLSLFYTVWIGGDFMSGRFLASPLLVAAMAIGWRMRGGWTSHTVTAVIGLYFLLSPLSPIKINPIPEVQVPIIAEHGIFDEARGNRQGTSLMLFWPFGERHASESFPMSPYDKWAKLGIEARSRDHYVGVSTGAIGFIGYFAGSEPHFIDILAVTDPLLARLPVSPSMGGRFLPGHMRRDTPRGYLLSCKTGENMLEAPQERDYYEMIRVVTRGDILSMQRFVYIWRLNLGGMKKYRHPLADPQVWPQRT